jgi:hypothetical protein
MPDVLRLAGRRVVVTAATAATGVAPARVLVDLGAEVHTAGPQRMPIPGLASFTQCPWDASALRDAIARVGRIVEGVVHVAGDVGSRADDRGAAAVDVLTAVVDAALALTAESAAAVVMVPGAGRDHRVGAIVAACARLAAELRPRGLRVHAVVGDPEAAAWPAVLLASPRAAGVATVRLDVEDATAE